MPESAERSAERKRLAREAGRRREALNVLRIIEATARYAATQMNGGLSPGLARAAALEAAAEMEMAAVALRRCVQLRPAERRALARSLAGGGAVHAPDRGDGRGERPERQEVLERRGVRRAGR